MKKRIVIIGGGYGGLLSALSARQYLRPEEAEITMVSKQPEHEIITELHRLAAGTINGKAVALPLGKLLRGSDIQLVTDTVLSIEANVKYITTSSGKKIIFDYLVIALGSQTAFFDIPGLEQHALTLKSVQDANRIRTHIEDQLDRYAKDRNPADAAIVIGGAGLTGIELVGELADVLPKWCAKRGIPRHEITLYNVEAAPDILPGFEAELVRRARTSLEKRDVRFITGVHIASYDNKAVHLQDGRQIATGTLVWTGGIQGHQTVKHTDVDLMRGRTVVNRHLISTSHPYIFAAGDSALCLDSAGKPYPPTAQMAWQMGETVGYNLFAAIKNAPMRLFQPIVSGKLGSLGRTDAIASIGESGTQLTGLPAVLMKEASKARYLAHIKALYAYAYE